MAEKITGQTSPGATAPLRKMDEQYYSDVDAGRFDKPIEVALPAGNELRFRGVMHSNNPEEELHASIKEQFESALDVNAGSGRKMIVVLEGWRDGDRPKGETVEEAIRARGENGQMEQLARAATEAGHDVEIHNYEPDSVEEFEQLIEEFGAEKAIYWHVLRQASQWAREHPFDENTTPDDLAERQKQITENQLASHLESLRTALGHNPSMNEVSLSFEMLNTVHHDITGEDRMDWNDLEHIYMSGTPVGERNFVNDIMRRSNEIRDEHILARITEDAQAGHDVFAVYGHGHAYTMEPALRDLASI
ncbi:MAG: hypothetical protein WAS27_03615 [Candidatus Saccharimonadales bacterium]